MDIGNVKGRQFREMVIRWREERGRVVPEVEFFHHWPKHEHLNREQLRWFLYWRTLWESGEVRKTSLSYMMIHIYELLSLEYLQNPQEAVERLIRFYSEFHDIQPKLDVTLVRWIGDLYLKLGELENALYWYTKGTGGDLYEKLSWYRYGGLDIPLGVMHKIAPGQKSQYYRERMVEIEPPLEELVQGAFRTFYRLEGEHALDRYARWTEEPVLYLFSNTPVHEKLYLDGFRRYDYSGQFVHFVKHAMRYAENLLRRVEGKPQLKCDASIGKYFQDVEELYPPKAPAEKKKKGKAKEADLMPVLAVELPEEPVEIDLSRVKALTEETEWLVEMMQEGEPQGTLLEEPPASAAPMEFVQAEEPGGLKAPAALAPEGSPERERADSLFVEGLFAGPEAGELEEFLEELSEAEQGFVRHVAQSGESGRRALAEWLKRKRLFLDATVLAINEKAMDAGLEPLLVDEDDEVLLEDEYAAVTRAWAMKEESDR